MRKFFFFILLGAAAIAAPLTAQAKTNVFACEPEWAALAEEIGGKHVKTYSATHARQDPHHIRARPSLLAKMRQSELVICSGAALEVGWLPILLQKAGRDATRPGGAYYIEAANLVPVLQQRNYVDRSMGDVHPQGNPHTHLNPYNILIVADALSDRLQRLDSKNAPEIQARHADFTQRWNVAIASWERRAAPLRGKKVVEHHMSWAYLLDWLGMESIAQLEPKPGLPPTARHLEEVLRLARRTPPALIMRTPYDPDDAGEWLSEKTGTPAVVLPFTIGGHKRATDLFSLFEVTLDILEQAQ